jgi:hypothetical protein
MKWQIQNNPNASDCTDLCSHFGKQCDYKIKYSIPRYVPKKTL